MGQGQERSSSLEQSISVPLRSHKTTANLGLKQQYHTLTSYLIDVVLHCNMIPHPELQIDHSAHTGDG